MITIDGSRGEGGGQVLRSSLALSLVTGRPFRIARIRAGRAKPGLMRQHLTCVQAAAAIGQAEVRGDALGSQELSFAPKGVQPGEYRFAVGTAGSCTLVLQTVLPALLTAPGASALTLEGGTHNPFAPPFDFLARAFLPLLNRMGPRVTATLERPGFYPAGGGKVHVAIQPAAKLGRLDLLDRGVVRRQCARALVSRIPRTVAERELKVVRETLGWASADVAVEEVQHAHGPGNALVIEVESEHVTEVFTGFGEKGVPAERVAAETVQEVRAYLAADVPVGAHLADQLLLPMALAGGGRFRTLRPTRHTETNAEVIQQFLDVEVHYQESSPGAWEVEIGPRGA